MSSILSSQGVVLATAMAVSGTLIFLTLCKEKIFPPTQLCRNQDSHPPTQILRSCLSSLEGKKRERKIKKRVHFADSVKDSTGKGEEFSREHRKSTEIHRNCGTEILPIRGMPANRLALYNGILRDRVQMQRIKCSY